MNGYIKKSFWMFLLFSVHVFANTKHEAAGIGVLANNLLLPVSVVSTFLDYASIIIGLTCIFAGIIRYAQYRVNPLMSPISSVILLLVIGAILIAFPYIYAITESGIPFTIG